MSTEKKQLHAVTGAFGFTGRYVTSRLLQAGHNVITLTNSPDRQNPFGGAVKAWPFDFSAPERMAEFLAGVDVLYNTYWVRFNRKNPELAQPDHEEAARNSAALFKAAKLAGVRKVVHVSIAHADATSPLPYYRGKAIAEESLRQSGLDYSIIRPAMLFGPGATLINNLAWTIRHFPICVIFGSGNYRVRPTFVDDLAAVMLAEGAKTGSSDINALGPQEFRYRDFMKAIAKAVGVKRPVIGLPVWLGYPGVWLLGKILGEPLATREEITALTSGLLTGGLQPRTLPASGLHSGEEPACQLHAGAESPPTQGADRTETPATQPGASPASAKTCTADAEPSVKTSTKAAPCDSIIAPESVITPTSITVWMAQNADSLGRHFIAETGRRKDRIKAY